jgi:S-adenosylmethionine hydrolase
VQSSYGSVRENLPLMIFGSRGCLEVAVNRGSASRVLCVEKGTPLRICMSDKKHAGA